MSSRFEDIVPRLEAAMNQPLPGFPAQQHMLPRPPRPWPPGFNIANVRHAGGLLLLFPVRNETHVVLTLRADTLGRHGGQVSLPGGVADPGETLEQAALREAHEEIGLDRGVVRTLGPLTPLDITVSGFRLHPYLAAATERPALQAAEGEVARIVEVSVDHLMRPASLTELRIRRDTHDVVAPAFAADGVEIWGATAMVLAEFLALLGWNGPGDR